MNSSLGKYSGHAFAIFRIIVGLMFVCHGAQKLFGMFGGKGAPQGMMLVGGIIEFGCGLLVALGLFTRPAAFLASGMMAVAYFMMHASGGALGHVPTTAERFFPLLNKGELAVLYCFFFLYTFFRGPGPLSLDRLIWGRTVASDSIGGPMRTGRDL